MDQAAVSAAQSCQYQMTDLGYNYRITDIQCALGTSQLTRCAAPDSAAGDVVVQFGQLYRKKTTNCRILRHAIREPRCSHSSKGIALPSQHILSHDLHLVPDLSRDLLPLSRAHYVNTLVLRLACLLFVSQCHTHTLRSFQLRRC